MKYIFLIFKLKALERLRKSHMIQYDSWVTVTNKESDPQTKAWGWDNAKYHDSEVRKIDNLIKLL